MVYVSTVVPVSPESHFPLENREMVYRRRGMVEGSFHHIAVMTLRLQCCGPVFHTVDNSLAKLGLNILAVGKRTKCY